MKWREVKILCAGMCVCTVIAAGTAIVKDSRGVKKLEEQATEMDMAELARTEMVPEAEVERHEVSEVGAGMETTDENTGYAMDRPVSEDEDADAEQDGAQTQEQPVQESNLIIADVTNYVNIRSMPSEEGEILGKLYDDSVGRMHGIPL